MAITIIQQPTDVTSFTNETVTFHVTAQGTNLSYQWEYKSAVGTEFTESTMSGNKTDTVSIPVTSSRNGQQYRCVITDSLGDSVTSNIATLTAIVTTDKNSLSYLVDGEVLDGIAEAIRILRNDPEGTTYEVSEFAEKILSAD